MDDAIISSDYDRLVVVSCSMQRTDGVRFPFHIGHSLINCASDTENSKSQRKPSRTICHRFQPVCSGESFLEEKKCPLENGILSIRRVRVSQKRERRRTNRISNCECRSKKWGCEDRVGNDEARIRTVLGDDGNACQPMRYTRLSDVKLIFWL